MFLTTFLPDAFDRQTLTLTENRTVRKQRKICSHTVRTAEYTEYLQPKVYIYRSRVAWGGRGRKFKSCHSDQKGDSSESPFFFVFRPKSRVFSHFSVDYRPNTSAKSDHIKPQKSHLTTCLTHSLTTWGFLRLLCEKIETNRLVLPCFEG